MPDLRLFLPLAVAALLPAACLCQTNTVPGEFIIDPPTLVSLGFAWNISGDDNRNARVDVTYRKKGEQQWRQGLPLLRLQREQVFGGAPREGGKHYYSFVAPNMFAGSLLNLEPGTEYECHFVLSDPDGIKGKAQKTVIARTRQEPQPATGGHVYQVYPFGYKGTKQEPAFTGLLAAYFMGSDQSDHSNAMPPRVQPGDIILVPPALLGLPYMVTAKAVTDLLVVLIPAEEFRRMAETELALAVALNRLLAGHWRLLLRHLTQTKSRDADTRLVQFLIDGAGVTRGAARFTLPGSKQDLAAHLGMTPATLSRSLKRLSPLGVKTAGSDVQIENIARLSAFSRSHAAARTQTGA